jgi:F-type H+-transporting ATPase subunit gamma
MAGLRDIRRRIRGVKTTQHITKAMKMVAAAKLRRTQEVLAVSRPYGRKMNEVLGRVVSSTKEITNPLMEKRDIQTVGLIVITSDSGLAGGYNASLLRKMLVETARIDAEKGFIAIGRKGRDFLRRRDMRLDYEYTPVSDIPTFHEAEHIARTVADAYLKGMYDEVHLIYQEFVSAVQQRPVIRQLLPIVWDSAQPAEDEQYIFEPRPSEVLDILLPRYFNYLTYQALIEAKTSEYGARMTAMESATDNAEEIIDSLSLSYNRARQAAITREIAEIVGGANAL